MSISAKNQICHISEDGKTCNLGGTDGRNSNMAIIYNGLEPTNFTTNDTKLFSSATDPAIKTSKPHKQYLREVRKIYSFISCPNAAIDGIINPADNNPDNTSEDSEDQDTNPPYSQIIENSQCQVGVKPTVFKDPCNPYGIFPTSTDPMNIEKDADVNGQRLLTNYYCLSGTPQTHNLMYETTSPVAQTTQLLLNEEMDLQIAQTRRTQFECDGKTLRADGQSSSVSAGSWIPTYDLTFTSPEFKINPRDVNFANVKNILNAGQFLSPAGGLTKMEFSYTDHAEIARGSLSQAELACTKEENCSGFLLSNDLKTSYLLNPTASPTSLTKSTPTPPTQYMFYYKKNMGPGSGSGTGITPVDAGGMCVPVYYDCASATNENTCGSKSKCVWATPVNQYPDPDADLNKIHAIDRAGCFPLDHAGTTTVLDPESILFSSTISQNERSDNGEIIWYNDFNPEYKHTPPQSLIDFRNNCTKIGGKVVGVKETAQNKRENDPLAGANEAFITTSTSENLYENNGRVQYYCVPKQKLTACGLGNNRGEPVQCCNGPIIVNSDDSGKTFVKNDQINGPICLGGGHPLAPPCQSGKHKNAPENNNDIQADDLAIIRGPTCSPTIAVNCQYAPTFNLCKTNKNCTPLCSPTNNVCPYAPTAGLCQNDVNCTTSCGPTMAPHATPPTCKDINITNTYRIQQEFLPGSSDTSTNVGWTYQSNNPPSQSPSDPLELIYPGGAGELITNNPNACWYNESVMTTGNTPDNIIMSQFRQDGNYPVLRADSTLRNDSCWAYKSGWKSGEEVSPVDYTGSVKDSTSTPIIPTETIAEGYEPPPDKTFDVKQPTGYKNNDYAWFPKPAGFAADIPYGGPFSGGPSGTIFVDEGEDMYGDNYDSVQTYSNNLQVNPTQQFYNMGWNGGYIKTPGQYTYARPDDPQIPNYSLSWLGGCNPITSTSNVTDYTNFNTMSYNYNACGNNCGGNCVMCNNWPENQVAKWAGGANTTGERKRSYVNWLPCKLNKNVNHLATSLVCRNCGPLNESNVPNYNNNPLYSDVESATNNYLWYPEWKVVGGVNGLWMQSSDGMCRATKKLETSGKIPAYPTIAMAFNPIGTGNWGADAGVPPSCGDGGSTEDAPCVTAGNVISADAVNKTKAQNPSNFSLSNQVTKKPNVNGIDGQGVTLAWQSQADAPKASNSGQSIVTGLNQDAGSDILKGNINNSVYKRICQTFPSDDVHIPYTFWSGMYPNNALGNGNSNTYSYMLAGDLFGKHTDLARMGKNTGYPNISFAYPGSWCLTSLDQTYLTKRTGANTGSSGTTHYWKMFSMGLSTPPDTVGASASFPLKAFTIGIPTSVWPSWAGDCGNQSQWDNNSIRNNKNSSSPTAFDTHSVIKRMQDVSKQSLTPTPNAAPTYHGYMGYGGSLAVLAFNSNAYDENWYTGGGGYNAHAGVVQQDGGSCASGRMICNNSYIKTPSGKPMEGDPRCIGGSNYNVGLSTGYAGSGDSPFGGTYMCWPENDDSYIGSGYAQTNTQCSTSAQPGGETLQSGALELPVSSTKTCQEDSDCREMGGCIWSETNPANIGAFSKNLIGLSADEFADTSGGPTAIGKQLYDSDTNKVDNMNFMTIKYNGPGKDNDSQTWQFGNNKLTTAGRWALADQNMDRSKAYCHKPTNTCIVPVESAPCVPGNCSPT